jgi:hypothetical protein
MITAKRQRTQQIGGKYGQRGGDTGDSKACSSAMSPAHFAMRRRCVIGAYSASAQFTGSRAQQLHAHPRLDADQIPAPATVDQRCAATPRMV